MAQKYYGDIDIKQKDNTVMLSVMLMIELKKIGVIHTWVRMDYAYYFAMELLVLTMCMILLDHLHVVKFHYYKWANL